MLERYKRIEQLGWDMQLLKKAKVLVVGAGALGNEVLKNLALLGVGNILLADMDVIEDHNLTRTILFRNSDIGQYKAEVAARHVKEIDPSVNIIPFVAPVQKVFGLGVYREADIVFGCLDNIQARMDVNRYCYQTNTLFIDAGLRKIDGDVKVFGAPYNVCLDCILTQNMRDEAWRRFSCLKLRTRVEEKPGPTAPTISSIMAGFQVQIGMKYLHDASVPIDSRISVLGYIDDITTSKLSHNPMCPTHNLYEPIAETEVVQLPYQSKQLKVGELLNLVQQDMGRNAVIELDYDLITHFDCAEHDYHKAIIRRRGYVYTDEVACPMCLERDEVESHALMQEYFINHIDSESAPAILNKTLAAIGTPLYQIFKAKAMKKGELVYKYFEISGDRGMVFR